MGSRSVATLRGRHAGETVYVLGSGKTMDYIPRGFFGDKITVVVNAVSRDFHTTYAFAHHREDAQEAIDRGLMTVASQYDRCDRAGGLNDLRGHWYQYLHPQQPSTLVMDMEPMERDLADTLVVGSNTVTSAMDFAGRILGAAEVVLCGVDSGSIDGLYNYGGYNGGVPVDEIERQTHSGTGIPHIRAQVSLIQTVADGLRARGIAVMSLNPFLDLSLEGHVYAR